MTMKTAAMLLVTAVYKEQSNNQAEFAVTRKSAAFYQSR